jgi:hypothetical protein
MTPSQLKANVAATGSYFFTRDSMKFFGDRMSNYGVRTASTVDGTSVWELYRKRPVKHNLQGSAYFDKGTFSQLSNSIIGDSSDE